MIDRNESRSDKPDAPIFAQIDRMRIHREGYVTIFVVALVLAAINLILQFWVCDCYSYLRVPMLILSSGFWLFIVSFFRIPSRTLTIQENAIVAPADGKVVVIEEVQADEYFTDKRIQVSIFMSPLNVHVNRNPVGGEVVYRKDGKEILVKQIAGALAKRICNYVKPGQSVHQTDEMGFIKFGSRVDLLLPLDAKIHCKIGDRPQGGVTVIATW